MTHTSNIVRDISVLYELALAVGTSLDPRESARTFLDTLVARRGLSVAVVWLREGDHLASLYAVPAVGTPDRVEARAYDALLGARGSHSFASGEEGSPALWSSGTESAIAIYRLGSLGFLELRDGRRRAEGFSRREMAQLEPVVSKFTVALGGAMSHQRLEAETAAREEASRATDVLRQFYEQILEAMPAQLAVFDPNGRYRYVTPSAIRDPERREAVIGKTDEDYAVMRGLDSAIARQRVSTILNVAASKTQHTFEESFKDRQGEQRYFVRFISPVLDASGEVTQVLGYGLDITEQKRSEAALRNSEARQRAILDAAPDAVVVIDEAGSILAFNPAAEAIFGWEEGEVIGKTMSSILVPERLRAAHKAGMNHYLTTGEGPVLGKRIELPALRADGSEFAAEVSIHAIGRPDGRRSFTAFMRDISDSKAAEEALAASESRYKQLVEESQDVIYRLGLDGRFTYVNAVASRLTGYDEEALLAMRFTDLVAPSHREEVAAFYMSQMISREPNTYLEFPAVMASGETRWAGQNVQLLEENGEVIGVQAVVRDVTERRRVMEALVEARERAEHASKARERFLANMSHEMRTPLNAVVGMGALLGEADLAPEAAEHLRALRNAAESLLGLINDILDITKIESGEILFERVPFDLRSLLATVADIVGFDARARGLDLSVEVGQSVPDVLIGDPTRVRQVVLNLVGNAVKFTQEGGVKVTARLASLDGDSCAIQIEVKDTGIGMAPGTLERVFDRFTQARSDTTRQYGGSGLGLAIVRELTERQGGTVHVESVEGHGSTFTVDLRFPIGEPKQHVREDEPADLTGARLLIVEDNAMNQTVARKMLEMWGASADVAGNGRLGVEAVLAAAASGAAYDLVLMDVQMPEMDGFEATRLIRASYPDLPVLALTASALVEQRGQMDEAGMNDLILKPFRPEHLRARVAHHLGRAHAHAAPSPEASGALSLAALAADTGGDLGFVDHILSLFQGVAPDVLDAMRAPGASPEDLASGAHKLKSSAGIIGADALHAALSTLEDTARDSPEADLAPLVRSVVAETVAALESAAAARDAIQAGTLQL